MKRLCETSRELRYLTNYVFFVQDASDAATWTTDCFCSPQLHHFSMGWPRPGTVSILLALAFLAAGEEACEAQRLG